MLTVENIDTDKCQEFLGFNFFLSNINFIETRKQPPKCTWCIQSGTIQSCPQITMINQIEKNRT